MVEIISISYSIDFEVNPVMIFIDDPTTNIVTTNTKSGAILE